MALYPTDWEQKQQRKQKEADEKREKEERQAFVAKAISKGFSEDQAEFLAESRDNVLALRKIITMLDSPTGR